MTAPFRPNPAGPMPPMGMPPRPAAPPMGMPDAEEAGEPTPGGNPSIQLDDQQTEEMRRWFEQNRPGAGLRPTLTPPTPTPPAGPTA